MDHVAAFFYQSLLIACIATIYSIYCGIKYYRNRIAGKNLKFIITILFTITFWGLFISMNTGYLKPRIFEENGKLIDKIKP